MTINVWYISNYVDQLEQDVINNIYTHTHTYVYKYTYFRAIGVYTLSSLFAVAQFASDKLYYYFF